ncbi:type I restriction-modification system endonuclease, partial [Myxococcota bacterium]|nr:type I restriction-modification system endonuclease [Myxococcota bacterium]
LELRYSKGTRPQKGLNIAIAEGPTQTVPADYVLFMGLTPVATVEAKKKSKNVRGDLRQAERYAWGLKVMGDITLPAPKDATEDFPGWPTGQDKDGEALYYRVPFVYSTNGRAEHHRQIESLTGIWFRDLRKSTNLERPLNGWHTPDGIKKLLANNSAAAHEKLKDTGFELLGLRDYQTKAIEAAEQALENGDRNCLLALATGTGKTRLVIGLLYRLIESKRIERALFLVDRSALGEQAMGAFGTVRPDGTHTFREIFQVEGLEDIAPGLSTRVHIATVQGMVQRLFHPSSDDAIPPIDQYDCIIIDEAHRGYTLDKEMGEGELAVRSFRDYVSTYRRVLDHFDAIKIGLTATPALHTREIFGPPIYTYSYREAVIDGWLVDHEPPLRIITHLAKKGIKFAKGEKVTVVTGTGDAKTEELPDEMDFEIDAFNKVVITENFNRVVCEELVQHLDPESQEKTLIFCATDAHADLVVYELKKALQDYWGEEAIASNSVVKVTSRADKVPDLIRRYKNEKNPQIAVTVDLLSTGIDVPPIANIVFLRRVKSRILYEQMLGRATRLCPEIGKEVFRVYDAVDLYAALQPVSTMKPVVSDVKTNFEILITALTNPAAHSAPGKKEAQNYADNLHAQIVATLHRRVRKIENQSRKPDAAWLEAAGLFEEMTKSRLKDFPTFVRNMSPEKAATYFKERPGLPALIDKLLIAPSGDGQSYIVSEHKDQIYTVEHGYGESERPEDYLDAFKLFVQENANKIPALSVVTQRPSELTRQQLRELRIKLDEEGYALTTLRTAWKETKNEDIAA